MKTFLRKIELQIRKKLKALLFKKKYGRQIKIDNLCDELTKCSSILILRQDRIGDLLVSIPFIRNLRKVLPTSKITILLSKRNLVAISCLRNLIDEIIVLKKNFLFDTIKILKLRKKFDLIIDPFDNASVTSSILIRLLKARYSLGFDKENKEIYTHLVELKDKTQVHIVERIANLLTPFGLNPKNLDLSLEYPITIDHLLPTKIKKRVGINISGSSETKLWGTRNFLKFINLVISKYDFEIVIFSTVKYKKETELIQKTLNIEIAPFTNNFDIFASMISTCDYLITPDTSVVHLASSFKIPTLVFYHFIDPKFGMPWFPYQTKFVYLTSKMDNFTDISPEFAFKSFCQLINDK